MPHKPMTIIFNATNLTQGIVYNSLDAEGVGYIRATLPILSGLNISCYIRLAVGGQASLLGAFSSTRTSLTIPDQFKGSKVRFQLVPNLDIPSLKIEFQEQYDYSFNRGAKSATGKDYDERFNQLERSINNYSNAQTVLIGGLRNDISNFLGNAGAVSIGISSAAIAYSANNPVLDIFWLLGNSESGYANPVVSGKINASNSADFIGSIGSIFNRDGGAANGWISANVEESNFTIDFLGTRSVSLTGVRLSCWNNIPVNILIEGSNNGSSWVNIYAWNSIGFSAAGEYRVATFSPSIAHRYIRLTQIGLNAGGDYYFSPFRLFLYGTITNV